MQANAQKTLSPSNSTWCELGGDLIDSRFALDLPLRNVMSNDRPGSEIADANSIVLKGRCMFANRREVECSVEVSTPDSMTLYADSTGPTGSRVIAYIDGLGRVEGLIRRTSSDGLDVAIVSTAIKRERLAQRLAWLVRMALAKVNDQRKYERDETRQGQDIAISIHGEVCKCQIVDESPSGMALRVDSKPLIGTYVFVDGSPAQVVRHLENGVAIKFIGGKSPILIQCEVPAPTALGT